MTKNLWMALVVAGTVAGVGGAIAAPAMADTHAARAAEHEHHAAFECPKCHAKADKAGECAKCHVKLVEAHDEHHDGHGDDGHGGDGHDDKKDPAHH
jgi:predicted RecA/RadA family phage recombinase